MEAIMEFYRNKKILLTGHTGFKGAWMCKALLMAGAEVTGYALEPPTTPALYDICRFGGKINSIVGDVRDLEHLKQVFAQVQPEIVIHMAAQPIVRESYRNPVYTYEANVMGTVNVLECVRQNSCVRSMVNVTTDKVYRNREWEWGYRENEELDGYDPYSNSKSCSELVTASYIRSFFEDMDVAVSTCRAGNVIGGGDFAEDRIIPDCIRAVSEGKHIIVRNPHSTRPYQHVLESVMAYLLVAKAQYDNAQNAGSYNVGPEDRDCRTTGELVDLFCRTWNQQTDGNAVWENRSDGGPHEANFLKLDCSKIKTVLGWRPVWDVAGAMKRIVEWSVCYREGGDVSQVMERQIQEYLKDAENDSGR